MLDFAASSPDTNYVTRWCFGASGLFVLIRTGNESRLNGAPTIAIRLTPAESGLAADLILFAGRTEPMRHHPADRRNRRRSVVMAAVPLSVGRSEDADIALPESWHPGRVVGFGWVGGSLRASPTQRLK